MTRDPLTWTAPAAPGKLQIRSFVAACLAHERLGVDVDAGELDSIFAELEHMAREQLAA